MHRERYCQTKAKRLNHSLMQALSVLVSLFSIVFSQTSYANGMGYNLLTPPGELVDIGNHRLHINCKGTGSPTVIIDSGMGGLSLEWNNIHDALAKDVTTCTYDRAGYGWSDVGPSPRTSSQIAHELYELIKAKKLKGPFILVGHSFGGYNMRYFANAYKNMIAGIVLVDSSHPEQFDRMDLKPVVPKTPKPAKSIRYTVSRPIMHVNYPRAVKGLAYRLLTTQKSHMTRMDELENFEESAHQVAKMKTLPNVPLVVLSRGKRVWPLNERGDKMEVVWKELQRELSELNALSLQVIAESSGHSIHLDQPQLVSSAILNTVHASRKMGQKNLVSLAKNTALMAPYQQTSLYEYFDLPLTGGQIIHKSRGVHYYDRTTLAFNLHSP